jgi:uncharacterized protein DUF1348
MDQQTRPPLPPFDEAAARWKVKKAPDAWNTRDSEKVSLVYSEDHRWRNRDEFFEGREEIWASWSASVLGSSTTGSGRTCGALPRTRSGNVRVREPRRRGTLVEIPPLRADCNAFPLSGCEWFWNGTRRGGRTVATPGRPARH